MRRLTRTDNDRPQPPLFFTPHPWPHDVMFIYFRVGESWVCAFIYTANSAGFISRRFFLQIASLHRIFLSFIFIFYRWLLKQNLILLLDITFSAVLPMYNTLEVKSTDIPFFIHDTLQNNLPWTQPFVYKSSLEWTRYFVDKQTFCLLESKICLSKKFDVFQVLIY